jgi:hypothetical protein
VGIGHVGASGGGRQPQQRLVGLRAAADDRELRRVRRRGGPLPPLRRGLRAGGRTVADGPQDLHRVVAGRARAGRLRRGRADALCRCRADHARGGAGAVRHAAPLHHAAVAWRHGLVGGSHDGGALRRLRQGGGREDRARCRSVDHRERADGALGLRLPGRPLASRAEERPRRGARHAQPHARARTRLRRTEVRRPPSSRRRGGQRDRRRDVELARRLGAMADDAVRLAFELVVPRSRAREARLHRPAVLQPRHAARTGVRRSRGRAGGVRTLRSATWAGRSTRRA